MSGYARQRAKERIAELASQGHDLVTFWREATDAIAPAIPFYLTPCFYTLDPASLLATSHYHDGLPEIPHEWLAVEYYEPDYNKMADVARSARGVATLQDATGGDVSRSAKYRVSMEPAAQQLLVTPKRPYNAIEAESGDAKQSQHRGRNHPAGCCNRTRLSDWNASATPTDTATAARSGDAALWRCRPGRRPLATNS